MSEEVVQGAVEDKGIVDLVAVAGSVGGAEYPNMDVFERVRVMMKEEEAAKELKMQDIAKRREALRISDLELSTQEQNLAKRREALNLRRVKLMEMKLARLKEKAGEGGNRVMNQIAKVFIREFQNPIDTIADFRKEQKLDNQDLLSFLVSFFSKVVMPVVGRKIEIYDVQNFFRTSLIYFFEYAISDDKFVSERIKGHYHDGDPQGLVTFILRNTHLYIDGNWYDVIDKLQNARVDLSRREGDDYYRVFAYKLTTEVIAGMSFRHDQHVDAVSRNTIPLKSFRDDELLMQLLISLVGDAPQKDEDKELKNQIESDEADIKKDEKPVIKRRAELNNEAKKIDKEEMKLNVDIYSSDMLEDRLRAIVEVANLSNVKLALQAHMISMTVKYDVYASIGEAEKNGEPVEIEDACFALIDEILLNGEVKRLMPLEGFFGRLWNWRKEAAKRKKAQGMVAKFSTSGMDVLYKDLVASLKLYMLGRSFYQQFDGKNGQVGCEFMRIAELYAQNLEEVFNRVQMALEIDRHEVVFDSQRVYLDLALPSPEVALARARGQIMSFESGNMLK